MDTKCERKSQRRGSKMTSSILACTMGQMAMPFKETENFRGRGNQEFSFSIFHIILSLLIYVTIIPLDDQPSR